MRQGHNSQPPIHCEIVTTPRHWLHATAIRSICFFEEHDAKIDLVFDGNDYTATHVVVYEGEEPVGTARVRFFKDFAKIERTSFRKSHRSIANLRIFAEFGFAYLARKGYTRVITHAGERYARLWKAVLGFRDSDKSPACFEGQEPFFEIWRDLEPDPFAIGLDASCAMLSRTEGAWDQPDPFEREAPVALIPS